jgi:hypothetical protein
MFFMQLMNVPQSNNMSKLKKKKPTIFALSSEKLPSGAMEKIVSAKRENESLNVSARKIGMQYKSM